MPEVRKLLQAVLPRIQWSPDDVIAWYKQQQRRKTIAQESHKKRWLFDHPLHVP